MNLHICVDADYSRHKCWLKTDRIMFAGAVFIHDHLLSKQDILSAFAEIRTTDGAIEFVKKLNGSFAIVLDLGGTIFLAVDRERTIPIFYKIEGDAVYVYNHISLETISSHGLNEQALAELENCLFVSGSKTLASNIYSVAAGETVVIADGNALRQYYFTFDHIKERYPDKQGLFQKIDEKFTEAIKRLISYLDGRCAVVPLSGGHDSRLVVYYLKKLGYSNIVTYTYGPKGNVDAATSEKVAQYLELDWHCVEYEPKQLQELFKKKFRELVDYYSNGVSSVCIQDWYAVDYLHRKGIFPENAVFVPGHSFDCIAGSFILPRYVQHDTVTRQELMGDILWKHYSEGKRRLSPARYAYYKSMIEESLLNGEPDVLPSDRAFNLYQNYNLRERQAKFICCQPKLYEYYGYDWYMPLWDSELIDFWETIDIRSKYNRRLFFEFTQQKYGGLMKAAPVENEKSKNEKKVNMNPVVRVIRKISQLTNYVDFHYCLAYFTRFDVYSMYLRNQVLNIGFFVNQKICKIVRRLK